MQPAVEPWVYSEPTIPIVQPVYTEQVLPIVMTPLSPDEQLTITGQASEVAASTEDRLNQVIRATVRITVSGVCGSGTVVGRDRMGNAIVLTNAHVAGTKRGRRVQLQRWDPDGSSERGQGIIIAAGYRRGISIDFALLKCNTAFASDVQPIPLADRYPDQVAGVSTFGCPRCEWPSLQVLKLTKSKGQVLRWKPEAIGGRSGSSVIDYTDNGPRVVGLLTWGGGGEGLGQSTPFLLDALRGRLPTSWETLPAYAREVATSDSGICCMPCGSDGCLLAMAQLSAEDETNVEADGDLVDLIVEGESDEQPDDSRGLRDRDRDTDKDKPRRPIRDWIGWFRESVRLLLFVAGAAAIGWLTGRFLPFPR